MALALNRYEPKFFIDDEYYQPFNPAIPERRLLAATLERAIADALSARCKISDPQHYRREAIAWFTKNLTPDPEIMSMQWICINLDLEPDVIRNIILDAIEKKRKFYRMGGRGNKKMFKDRIQISQIV